MKGVAHPLRGFGTTGPMLPPAVPAFTVDDNRDGTVTVAITAGSPGSEHAWTVQRIDGELGGATWQTAGQRTGAGAIVAPLAPGYYWGRVVSTETFQTVTTHAVFFRATDGSEAMYFQCLEATRARIQSLLLDGLPNSHVVILKTAEFQEPDVPGLPAVLIVPDGHEEMPATAGTNGRDDVTYPVRVVLLAAGNQDPAANAERMLAWREEIARAFRHQRLPGLPSVIDTHVEPLDAVNAEAWWHQYDAGSLRLQFVVREVRGFGS